jgi:PAS domain S-box-containing protein
LAAIVESSEDAIIGKSLEGIVTSWNEGARRLFGFTAEEMLGQPGSRIIPLQRSEEEAQILTRIRQGERVEQYEAVRCHKDGGLVDVSLTIPPIRDRTGRIIGVSKIARDITKQKKAETAAQHALEQLQEQAALLELAPVLVRDLENRIVLWTRGAEQLYGYSEAEALGRVSHELFQTEFEQGKAYVDEMLSRVGQWEGELVHRKRDGERLLVASQQIVYRDSSGRPVRILEVNADITERKRVEQSLHESQARFAGIIDSAMDAIISIDEAQRVVLFNAAAERMFGCDAADALGKPLDRFIPARLRSAHREHVRAFGATGATNRAMGRLKDLMALRADGQEFPIEAAISQTEIGEAKVFTVILRDITERKTAEGEREAKIRRLVEANIIGILIWNLEGQIIEANEAFLRMVQYSREDLISGRLRWTDLTPVEWRARDEQAVAMLKATGTVQPREKEYFRKDGSRVPVLIGAALLEGSGNEGVAFVLDLSEQRRAEHERKTAEEVVERMQAQLAHITRVTTLGELTASIAHEISQPLTAVVTNAKASLRWLALDSPDLAEACESIHRIVRDGNRASDVIARMRALFKKDPTPKELLDVNEVIQEVLMLSQGEVRRNRVSVRTRFANDLPFVMGDRIQLQQVILNLVLNAIQAMSEVTEGPRELEVCSEKVSGRYGGSKSKNCEESVWASAEWTDLLISVGDSGPGMDPQLLNRLFEAFYTTKPQGLGMGLTISRSIIEAHGGQLWAKANAPRGAVFQFTLPIHVEE